LGVTEHHILLPSACPSQIFLDNEGDRHLQLAEQRVRLTLDLLPVDGAVALFFREDLTEPDFQLASIHRGQTGPLFRIPL